MSKSRSSFSKRDRERRKAEKNKMKRLRREERKHSEQQAPGETPVGSDVVLPEASDGSQPPPAPMQVP